MPLEQLPNAARLRPSTPHKAHVLISGYLLADAGCSETESGWLVNVCRQCHQELKKPNVSTPPKFSLANGLCVGEVPAELLCLTLAEQLLIARVYPRVFVVKLFPKSTARYGLDDDQLQGALQGNVTSFELNSDSISDMVAGNLMPQPPEVLASVLSVTFIGRGRLPNRAALRLFQVRRHKIAEALEWLRINNPKYYGDIRIDNSRLAALPIEDVPPEILINMHQEIDDSVLNVESDGYVPEYNEEDADLAGLAPIPLPSTDENDDESMEPDVVPLQYLGVMDNDLTRTSTDDIMASGLVHLGQHDSEGGYAVRHGAPVNTFGQPPAGAPPPDPDRPNYWERAFPMLYPFGTGGIKSDRPVHLSFIEHVRWSLQYYDRRFRLHHTFAFMAFGIHQRRQVLSSARIQMKRRDFDAIARTLSSITPQDLRAAAEEEERGQAPSNPSISVLKRYVNATASRVMGSDAARYQLRSQIWSTSAALNPPTLWMTINPDDLHDPIAQIFAGEEIDMDDFVQTAGPDKNQRSRNIARDPYAAAEFFNFLVTLILEKLLGVRATPSQIHSSGGILGHISAYFGVVECQGRGTLHLHMLVWLKNAPSPDRLKELLRTPEFKSTVVDYMRTHVRAFLPQLATSNHLQATAPDPEVCYSRFPDPYAPETSFRQALEDLETRVVRTKQMHSCSFGRCLKPTKHGRLVCKRRAPFELSEIDSVEDDGTYHIKRTLGYLNNYCPAILVTAKCNNDIKLLLHGTATNNITFYVAGYIAKKQGKSYNVSGLLAEHLVYHFASNEYNENLRERQRLLLLRAVNVLNREQEVPAPLAISHLMGWGDVYRSHHYVPVYWGSFISEIYKEDPSLKNPRPIQESETNTITERVNSAQEETNVDDNSPDSETVVLRLNQHGQLHFRSQVEDYIHRGDCLEDYNVMDFLVNTYEQKGRPKSQTESHQPMDTGGGNDSEREYDDETGSEAGSEDDGEGGINIGIEGKDRLHGGRQGGIRRGKRGRPAHSRVPYRSSHPSHSSHVRVIRARKHNSLPNFIGPRLPSRNDQDQSEFYAASILTLVKPWRRITDLKEPGRLWANTLQSFLSSCNSRIQDLVSSFNHYYECKAASEADKKNIQTISEEENEDRDVAHEDVDMEPPDDMEQSRVLTESDITSEMIAKARLDAAEDKHPEYGREAVRIGETKGVFTALSAPIKSTVIRGREVDSERLVHWQKLLQEALEAPESAGMTSSPSEDSGSVSRVDNLSDIGLSRTNAIGTVTGLLTQNALDPAAVSDLFPEQLRAFKIVQHHLTQTLDAIHTGTPRPPQLLMLLVGEGGTGKSKVIQTITAEFERRGVAGMLMKAAYTGIAASLIQGKTTHNIGCISVKTNTLSEVGKTKLAHIWKDVQYLIIDEYSMLSKEFFGQLSKRVQIGRMPHDPLAASADFGAVNVIVCGDGHQFPPVRGGASAALYTKPAPGASVEVKLGWDIFRRFTTVVTLRRQVRVTDEKWRAFLTSLRRGEVQPSQLDMLRSLVLTHPSCEPTDFELDPWRNVSMVTPRNSVRNQWNDAAVKKHCQKEGRQLFICPASDTIRKRPLTMIEQLVAVQVNAADKPGGLPDTVMLAVGLKVMVTLNVETDLDIANGARGEIVDIVLDPNEPMFDSTAAVVTLQHLPVYILVKMARHTRNIKLPGLDAGIIPIVPASKSYKIVMDIQKGRQLVRSHRMVRRLQFPVTPAYSFTDYRSQGQTIESVIVDLMKPPTGKGLTLFNIYVALSRSSGTKSIRILRDFDVRLLMQPLDAELAEEDKRLEELDARTVDWYEKNVSDFVL